MPAQWFINHELEYCLAVILAFLALISLLQYFLRSRQLTMIKKRQSWGEKIELRVGWQIIESSINKYLRISIMVTKKNLGNRKFLYKKKTKQLIIDPKYYFGRTIVTYYICSIIIANVIWIHNRDIRRFLWVGSSFSKRIIAATVTCLISAIISFCIASNHSIPTNITNIQWYSIFWAILIYIVVLLFVEQIWLSWRILCIKRFLKKFCHYFFQDKYIYDLNTIANISLATIASDSLTNRISWIWFHISKLVASSS